MFSYKVGQIKIKILVMSSKDGGGGRGGYAISSLREGEGGGGRDLPKPPLDNIIINLGLVLQPFKIYILY